MPTRGSEFLPITRNSNRNNNKNNNNRNKNRNPQSEVSSDEY